MNQMSRMNDSDTTTHSSTSTGSFYPAERPLRNVNIDPSYASVIEEQDQKIKHLQQQLAEFNNTCWCKWTIILGGNDIRNHKWQILFIACEL